MSDILVIQGQPFEHFFPLPAGTDIDNVDQSFEVGVTRTGGETVVEFIPNSGATLSTRGDEVVLVLSAADTASIPVGVFEYSVVLLNREFTEILNVGGQFRVVPAPHGLEPSIGPVRPWDLFNPSVPRASKELRDGRMEICRACPELLAGFCKICGCRMKWKTTLIDAVCALPEPDRKW